MIKTVKAHHDIITVKLIKQINSHHDQDGKFIPTTRGSLCASSLLVVGMIMLNRFLTWRC